MLFVKVNQMRYHHHHYRIRGLDDLFFYIGLLSLANGVKLLWDYHCIINGKKEKKHNENYYQAAGIGEVVLGIGLLIGVAVYMFGVDNAYIFYFFAFVMACIGLVCLACAMDYRDGEDK